MSALRVRRQGSLVREPLDPQLPIPLALRCLHDTERPFALFGAWAGGGTVLGCCPARVAADDEDPFALISEVHGEPQRGDGLGGGWVGYLGYPLRGLIENGHPSPASTGPLPAFVLAYYDHVVRRDAGGAWWFEALWSRGRARALEDRFAWWAQRLADPPPPRSAHTSDWRLEPTPAGHAALVAACRERIYAGDLFQANLCAALRGRVAGPPLELFIDGVEALAPDRAAYLEGPWGAVVSLSPELFLERRGRQVRTAPIKGTGRRSQDPQIAASERGALARSGKDRAENVMIVDLMRNDLGRVCKPGTIVVESLAQVRGHAGVWHLVSEIRGSLRPEVDDGELLRATFPPGSVTGAPKIAAMNVIAELESAGRQAYTGAIGIASPHAGLELSVAIRTFEVAGSAIRLGIGGGVVADSDPETEAAELAVKAFPLLEALGAALPDRTSRDRAPLVRRLGPVPVPRPDRGRGVFETVLVQDGRALRIDAHLARLRASVAMLYGAQLSASISGEIAAVARRAPARGRLRIDLRPTAHGRLEVDLGVQPLGRWAAGRMRTWTVPGGLGSHKWIDRRLIDAMEQSAPGELPLLVDADGQVLEASRASVFAQGADGVVRTPADDGRILPGVARALVLSRVPELGHEVTAAPLTLDDLRCASGVVLTSALRCIPVLELDGRPLSRDTSLLAMIESALGIERAGASVRAAS